MRPLFIARRRILSHQYQESIFRLESGACLRVIAKDNKPWSPAGMGRVWGAIYEDVDTTVWGTDAGISGIGVGVGMARGRFSTEVAPMF